MESKDLFEILVRETMDSVRAFLLSSVRDTVAAEDLLQETYLVAWRNLDRYDRQLPFGPWVRGIAGKLLLNWRRKTARHRVLYCDAEVLGALDQKVRGMERLTGDSFDEKLDALRGCMARLSTRQAEALTLHYEHGLHCKEIARRLGLGLEAVKKHLQRGRAALARCLEYKVAAVQGEQA